MISLAWEYRKVSEKPREIPRVAILIPHTGEVSLEWADRVYGPLKYKPSPDFDKMIFPVRGVPWDVARNMLVKEALKDPKVTHLMWIDSDITFEEPPDANEAILRLMRCNAPISSGVYRARQQQGFNYAMWLKHPNGFVAIDKWSGNWIKVDVVGMGCCLCKREVFERIPEPWFWWGPGKSPSEDFNFCLKAAEHGYNIMVHTEIRASHISGKLKIKSDGTVIALEV